MSKFKPFSLSALESLAKIIGDRYTGSEITELFTKADLPGIVHDGSTKWRFVYASFKELQKTHYGDYKIIKVIQVLCGSQEYIGNQEHHRTILDLVNEILAFNRLKVNDEGIVVVPESITPQLRQSVSRVEKLFDSRNYHYEVRKHARDLFVDEKYFHAVFECCKAFDKYVQSKSLISASGFSLMSKALSIEGPLKVNGQSTESEIDEQKGVMHLCMGLSSAVRNIKAHEPVLEWPITEEDALDILSLISFLWRKIDDSIYCNLKSI
jgi:uncharacterized protein (TIGR02391 family)